MNVCVTIYAIPPRYVWPVLDPRRTAGPGPHTYGYVLSWDGVEVTVARDPALSNCEMTVVATTTLPNKMDVWGLNLYSNTWTSGVGNAAGFATTMRIRRRGRLGQSCEDGTDTVRIRCEHPLPWGTAEYFLAPEDFWDFWGGHTVTFDWIGRGGNKQWGNQTPPPTYPIVREPDGTFMREDILLDDGRESERFYLVFGGAGFQCGYGDLPAMGLQSSSAVPYPSSDPLPSTPADFTVVRELFRPEMYVVYGGAGFLVRDMTTLFSLGFSGGVRVIPPRSSSQLRTVPFDGTLLREQNDPKVYLVENNQLRWVTSEAVMQESCLPWRHVRIVPNNSLAALPRGPDFPSTLRRPDIEIEQWARPPLPSGRPQR